MVRDGSQSSVSRRLSIYFLGLICNSAVTPGRSLNPLLLCTAQNERLLTGLWQLFNFWEHLKT